MSSLSCHLYQNGPVGRFWKSLKSCYGEEKVSFKREDFVSFDQMHYGAEEATEACAKILGLKKSDLVLDVGGGFGGPSRYLADRYACEVHMLEIQKPLTNLASEVNRLCSLEKNLKVLQGNFLDYEFKDSYDKLISLLVFLHIPNKEDLWQRVYKVLKTGAQFVVEDYYLKKHPDAESERVLKEVIGVPCFQSLGSYKKTILDSGLTLSNCEEMTEEWSLWTKERFEGYEQSLLVQEELHGKEASEDLLYFYEQVSRLFDRGVLGGLRVSGEKA